MRPASYLAAPPRGAVRSIASAAVTYGWGALGFCLLAAVAGAAFAAGRGWALWRDLRAVQRTARWALAEVAAGLARAERHLGQLPAAVDEVARAAAALGESLARARMLEAAAREALTPFERARGSIPRKRV